MPVYDPSWKADRQTLPLARRNNCELFCRNGFQFLRKVNGLSGTRGSTEIFFDLRIYIEQLKGSRMDFDKTVDWRPFICSGIPCTVAALHVNLANLRRGTESRPGHGRSHSHLEGNPVAGVWDGVTLGWEDGGMDVDDQGAWIRFAT